MQNNQKKIKQMLIMQQNLNDETNGIGWEDGYTKNQKIINWKRCIYMECAELIDSFAWKHWKNINALPNEENIKIEIADIWHFILSLMLERNFNIGLSLDDCVNEICSVTGFSEFCFCANNLKNYSIYEIINDIEIIIHQCSGFDFEIHNLLTNYFRLCIKCGVNIENLFKIYMAKNILNKFRQDHGYKDGTYRKNWSGKEDNEVLNEILEKFLDQDEIYKNLKLEYERHC